MLTHALPTSSWTARTSGDGATGVARSLAGARSMGRALVATARQRLGAPVEGLERPGDERYEVTRLASHAEIAALRPEWEQLYEAGHQNPFNDPGWLLAWARAYVPADEDLWVVTVRRDGRLVGVLPCYRAMLGRHGVAFRSIQLFGCLITSGITELPSPLTHPDEDPRGVTRTALRYLIDRAAVDARAHWIEVTLDRDVPWLEAQWFRPSSASEHPPTIMTKAPRAVVTLPLPAAPEPLVLKRNVKESVRRARNRLTKSGKPWSVRAVTGKEEVSTAFETLRVLHTARSALTGKEAHMNSLTGVAAEFLRNAVVDLAGRGRAAIYQLELDGAVIAAQLVLTNPHASYLSVSGLTAEAWAYSPMALIIHTVATDAIARGAERLHLSAGPDEAKLRWSEQVDYYPQFLVVPPTVGARVAFAAYWPLSAALRYRREFRLHTIRSGD
jgi:CelD/BcsL family acetyltransferase involved in cellulose biosynthesis